jgi:hypothetical protein
MLLGRRSDCGWLAGKLGKLSSFVRAYVCLFSTSRHGSASMFWSSDKRNGSKLGRFWNAVARVFNHCRKSEVENYFVILQCSGTRALACQVWVLATPHAPRRICFATRKRASWREEHRRVSNGDQVQMISGLAMKRGPSVDFCGYWQRRKAA